jgi:hypothetical protein
MIELGPISEFEMSYNDAIMYLFCLGDGWRLPTYEEFRTNRRILGWYQECESWPIDLKTNLLFVYPVRNLT